MGWMVAVWRAFGLKNPGASKVTWWIALLYSHTTVCKSILISFKTHTIPLRSIDNCRPKMLSTPRKLLLTSCIADYLLALLHCLEVRQDFYSNNVNNWNFKLVIWNKIILLFPMQILNIRPLDSSKTF